MPDFQHPFAAVIGDVFERMRIDRIDLTRILD